MYKLRTNLLRKQVSLNFGFLFVCIFQDWITLGCQFRKCNIRILKKKIIILTQDSFFLSHVNEGSPGLIQKLHVIIRCPNPFCVFPAASRCGFISKTDIQDGHCSSRITSTFQTEEKFTRRISICFLTLVTFIMHTPLPFIITLAKVYQLGHTQMQGELDNLSFL